MGTGLGVIIIALIVVAVLFATSRRSRRSEYYGEYLKFIYKFVKNIFHSVYKATSSLTIGKSVYLNHRFKSMMPIKLQVSLNPINKKHLYYLLVILFSYHSSNTVFFFTLTFPLFRPKRPLRPLFPVFDPNISCSHNVFGFVYFVCCLSLFTSLFISDRSDRSDHSSQSSARFQFPDGFRPNYLMFSSHMLQCFFIL